MSNTQLKSEIKKYVASLAAYRGKSKMVGSSNTGLPVAFTYEFDQKKNALISTFHKSLDKKNFRRLEPWAFSVLSDVRYKYHFQIGTLKFHIKTNEDKTNSTRCNIEAFRRRISFLAINNPNLIFTATVDKEKLSLYEKDSLFKRPNTEVIRENIRKRRDTDVPGRLEKDFQVFLFGKGLYRYSQNRTNERLAILGEDFYHLKQKDFKLLREFATGAFKDKISKSTQILPTEFADIVTFNKYGDLAIIELKLDNAALDVISQLLDYALYFRCYIDRISPILEQELNGKINKRKIICYVANNYYHPRFKNILDFYRTENKGYGFKLKQLILGHTVSV